MVEETKQSWSPAEEILPPFLFFPPPPFPPFPAILRNDDGGAAVPMAVAAVAAPAATTHAGPVAAGADHSSQERDLQALIDDLVAKRAAGISIDEDEDEEAEENEENEEEEEDEEDGKGGDNDRAEHAAAAKAKMSDNRKKVDGSQPKKKRRGYHMTLEQKLILLQLCQKHKPGCGRGVAGLSWEKFAGEIVLKHEAFKHRKTISSTAIKKIKKNEERIISFAKRVGVKRAKKAIRSTSAVMFPEVEEALWQWFVDMRDRDFPVSDSSLKTTAEEFHRLIYPGNEEWTASVGWLDGFKKRHQFSSKYMHGESKSANVVEAEAYREAFARRVVRGLVGELGVAEESAYNADETGLLYLQLNDKTLSSEGRQQPYRGKICEGNQCITCHSSYSSGMEGDTGGSHQEGVGSHAHGATKNIDG